jgi:ectoine hydroxylase-related dioxygenase (phytanoyl-CoA dioxygenase family)
LFDSTVLIFLSKLITVSIIRMRQYSAAKEIKHEYESFGVIALESVFSSAEIDEFINTHKDDIQNQQHWSQSYLPSRESFMSDSSITDLLFGEKIKHIFSLLEVDMKLVVAEARLASSRIGWHRDVTWETEGIPEYLVVSISMSDSDIEAGLISYVPGSHLWGVDYEIVGREKISGKGINGYEYYENLIKSNNGIIKQFDSKKGDVLIWNGNMVHRGELESNQQAIRHSLTGHFVKSV